MPSWRDDLPLKVTNLVSYFLFLGSNGYSALGPNKGHYATGAQDTFITPQASFFGIFGLVHLLLLGYVLYQFHPNGLEPVRAIGWRFPLLAISNAVYSYLSSLSGGDHSHNSNQRVWAILAFGVMLFIAATVSTCFHSLKTSHQAKNILDIALIHLPFSLWHGLSVVLAVVSGFQAFGTDASQHKPGVISDICVFLALLFLESTAVGYSLYGQGDIAGGLVITWGLLSIFQHQTVGHADKIIHYGALVLFILSLLAVLRSVVAVIRGRNSTSEGERAPLLG